MSERYNNMKEINYYRVDTIPYYYIAEIVKTNHPLYGKKVKIDNFRIADTTYKILHLLKVYGLSCRLGEMIQLNQDG